MLGSGADVPHRVCPQARLSMRQASRVTVVIKTERVGL